MKKKLVAGSILCAAMISPAMAQEFYVIQDSTTKRCTIVDKKPTTTTTTVVGPTGTVYKTRTEAESAVKTIKVCETK